LHNLIIADPKKCTGCEICQLACSALNEKAFRPRMSRIKVARIEPLVNFPLACRLCEKPACVASCPRGALRVGSETGIIVVDEKKCDGCGWCLQACEFGAITIHPDKKTVVICDLCPEKTPVCVKLCPEKALQLTNMNTVSGKARWQILNRRFLAVRGLK